jgi:rhamnosyl/mannosyltransferase
MKVLHIYKDYYPVIGGIENHMKTLAEYQARHGFEVTVLATSTDGRTTEDVINSVRVIKASRIATMSSTPLSVSLFKWVCRLETDITHLHFPYPVGEIASYFLGKSKHTIITYHSDVIKQKFILPFLSPLLRKVLDRADRIIATSPNYIDSSPFLSSVRGKCVVVPLGIDIRRFSEPDNALAQIIRAQYNGSKIVLFVGRLRYFKGLQYLVEAMKSVDGHLLIIGTGPEGDSLKVRVKEGKIDNISFLDDIHDDVLPDYYNASDIFVLPSSHRSEAFGTVLIEAMASGKPVISTELGTGTSFINAHGETGFVVPPKDPGALSQSINELLNNDSLRMQFSANALKRSSYFSSDVLNKKIAELYRSYQ